jgi:hypothetical protein
MAGRVQLALFGAAFRTAIGVGKAVSWVDRTFKPAMPFPRDTDELRSRQEWGVRALRDGGGLPQDAEVTRYVVTPMKEAEAFRSMVASLDVEYVHGGVPGKLEVVAKFAPRAESLREHAVYILQKNHIKEAGFYAKLSAHPDVEAPRCYFAQAHASTGNLCVLMERMSGCREFPESHGCPPELLDLAIDAFAGLHAAFWERHDEQTAFLETVPDTVVDYFATLFEGEDREIFGALLRAVWRHDGQAPVTVIHSDPRVGNMMFPGADGQGRFALIDWQAARKGKGVFDVAYFIVLSLEPEVRRAHQARLLDRYHAGLVARGVTGYSKEQLLEDYRYAELLTLAFVTLPFMSAEASSTEANAEKLHELGVAWLRRMIAVVDELDLEWAAARTGLDAAALRAAFARSNAKGMTAFE